ncbi:MAG: hypothetical protein WAN46_10655 [Gammaproteobacteria bacterium]|jgi:hypothetical protein
MIVFLSHFLFILAAWTLTIKFFFPMGYALAQGLPLGTHIYWDFWWVVHLWLGWALLARPRYTFSLAMLVSIAEIIIVVTKLMIFLSAPEWTIWSTNWFINKMFVLACFTLLLGYCLVNRKQLRGAPSSLRREALT